MIRRTLAFSILYAGLSATSTFAAMDCNNLPGWTSGGVFTGGTTVSYDGSAYRANWWTQGANPAQNSGQWQVWSYVDSCNGGGSGSSSSGGTGSSSSGGGSSTATLYEHCDYNGWGISISEGSYTLGDLYSKGFTNDQLSSIKVSSGYEAILYEHDNFQGASITVSGNDGCLVNEGFNDYVSSLKIQKSGGSSSSSSGGGGSSSGGSGNDCGTPWYSARLTHYTSYPDPGSDECLYYNGCQWAGYFYGVNGKKPESWVQANNIIAVHMKDWNWLGLKEMNLRQGSKFIKGTVYDACSDSDCSGCCTANLAGDGYLIDIEKYTMQRFGSGDGIVEFQVCN